MKHLRPTYLLGLDVGTTHCKAALFDAGGRPVRTAVCRTPVARTPEGHPYHDPDALWEAVSSTISEAMADADRPIAAAGVASMAEAGLLIDRETGQPRTHIIPWYDSRASQFVAEIERGEAPLDRFRRTGLHASFKFALPKLLWLRERNPRVLEGALWLSVADYIVCRLTGRAVTDPSLAARTYLYRLSAGSWDEDWMARFGLSPHLFPAILPTGEPAGGVTGSIGVLPAGTPVAVCGHDHIASMLAAGVVDEGSVLDSLGTAESMLGVLNRVELGEEAFDSGLAVVPHALPGRFAWLGGLSSAGGAVEWLRGQLGDEGLSYDEVVDLADVAGPEPTGITFFPYLAGSGAPLPDGRVRAAFVGLDAGHGREHLVKAVLEGTAYASEGIRRAAERLTGMPIEEMVAVGGGARNRPWMQVRSDVTGCRFRISGVDEAAALGAALAAGLGAGVFSGVGEVKRIALEAIEAGESVEPDPARHALYTRLYEESFLPMQSSLRDNAARVAHLRPGE